MRKRNASDFIDDLGRDVQCGASHFGFHIRSIIVRAHNLQVHVELIDKTQINIHRIEDTQPPILLKNPTDFKAPRSITIFL